MSSLNPLHSTEPLVTLVKDSVDAHQESIAEDIKGQATSAPDTTINHTISSVRESQVFFLNRELLVANREGDDYQLIRGGVGREDVALLIAIILGAWNCLVDGLALHRQQEQA